MLITVVYFAYTNNTIKHIADYLYCMGLLVTYKTVRLALQANRLAINKDLQRKVWE